MEKSISFTTYFTRNLVMKLDSVCLNTLHMQQKLLLWINTQEEVVFTELCLLINRESKFYFVKSKENGQPSEDDDFPSI